MTRPQIEMSKALRKRHEITITQSVIDAAKMRDTCTCNSAKPCSPPEGSSDARER